MGLSRSAFEVRSISFACPFRLLCARLHWEGETYMRCVWEGERAAKQRREKGGLASAFKPKESAGRVLQLNTLCSMRLPPFNAHREAHAAKGLNVWWRAWVAWKEVSSIHALLSTTLGQITQPQPSTHLLHHGVPRGKCWV